MNKKRISINIVMNVLSFLLSLAITFFLTPYIIRVLGKEAYGFFPMANTIISYTGIFTIAINSMAGRYISITYHRGEKKKAETYFNTVLLMDIIIAIVLFMLCLVVVLYLDKIINIPKYLVHDVKMLFFLLYFSSMLLVALSAYKTCTFVKNRIDIDAYVSILKAIIRAVILIVLFVFFAPNIVYVGVASCIVFILEALLYVRIKKKIMPDITINLKLYSKKSLIKLMKSGVWNLLGKLNSILAFGLDLLFANIFFGAIYSSNLAIAKNIPTYSFALCNIIALSFIPALTKAYAKDKSSLWDNLKKSFLILCLLGSLIMGGVISLGDVFYRLWLPDTYSVLFQYLSILTLLPTLVSYGIMTIRSVFIIQNNVKLNSVINLITALLSCVIVIVLIKTTTLGLYAIAGVSSIFFVIKDLVFTLPYISKCLEKKWYSIYPYMFKSWLCVLIVVIISVIVRNIFTINTWLQFGISAIVIVTISLIINLFIITNKSNRAIIINKIKFNINVKNEMGNKNE